MVAGYENIIDNAEAAEFLKKLMEHPFYQQFFETYHSGTLVTEIPLNVSWFGTPEDGRRIRHYYDFEHKCYSKIVYQQNSSIMESIEITTFNGRHEKLEYGIGTIKVEEADNPFLTEEVGTNLMYADMKDSGYEKVILMLASMLMQMHGIDKSTRKPLDQAELIDGVEMPEDIYEAVHDFNVPKSKEKEAIAHLCYDAMKHIDDDIRDLYACHVKTPHGVKGFTYHNTHPNLHEIQAMDKDFVQFCLDNLKGENEENEIVDYIAAKVAEYILGEDFRLFFDENIRLPRNLEK